MLQWISGNGAASARSDWMAGGTQGLKDPRTPWPGTRHRPLKRQTEKFCNFSIEFGESHHLAKSTNSAKILDRVIYTANGFEFHQIFRSSFESIFHRFLHSLFRMWQTDGRFFRPLREMHFMSNRKMLFMVHSFRNAAPNGIASH